MRTFMAWAKPKLFSVNLSEHVVAKLIAVVYQDY